MDERRAKRLIDETTAILEEEAAEWAAVEALWRPLVDEGDLDAQFHLAHFYLDYGFDEEPAKNQEIEQLLKAAADRGHPDAIYLVSRRQAKGKDRDVALLAAGELGSLEARRDLGALFATGDWTGTRDPVRAAEWYRRAAERGHPDAQYNLGFMYLCGEGVQANPGEGLRWLRCSAGQGDEQSLRLLADVYRKGSYGVPIDLAEAKLWDEKYFKTELYRLRVQRWGGEGA